MKLSVASPESIRLGLTNEELNNHPAEGVIVTVEGGIISFEFSGESLDERIESLTDLDAWIGIAVADEDRPEQIRALSDLKALVAHIAVQVRHESSYRDAQQDNAAVQVEEATDADTGSHPTASQNASSEGSSEQHGVAADNQNEENVNVEAHEKEQQPRSQRAAGR